MESNEKLSRYESTKWNIELGVRRSIWLERLGPDLFTLGGKGTSREAVEALRDACVQALEVE